jgi:hypothetical protein
MHSDINMPYNQYQRIFFKTFNPIIDVVIIVAKAKCPPLRDFPTDISQYRLRFGFSLLYTDRVPFELLDSAALL